MPHPPSRTRNLAWTLAFVAVFAAGVAVDQARRNFVLARQLADLRAKVQQLQGDLAQGRNRLSAAAVRTVHAEREAAGLRRRLATAQGSAGVAPATTSPATQAERLARHKADLAAGQPLRGALVVYVEGQPKSQDVAFVMGQETRWAVSDALTYRVTPNLQDDGSVKYVIQAEETSMPGGPAAVSTLPWVIALPWGGFSLDDGQHTVGFDPDPIAP